MKIRIPFLEYKEVDVSFPIYKRKKMAGGEILIRKGLDFDCYLSLNENNVMIDISEPSIKDGVVEEDDRVLFLGNEYEELSEMEFVEILDKIIFNLNKLKERIEE